MLLAWINLALEVGIVGTGGLVRLSGSGLGRPRWPECVSGSITPVSRRAQEWHKYIEVGNRMLTSAVSVVAVLLILAIIGHRRASDRWALLPPAFGVLGGIVLQAVVGGVSVLTDLNPYIVAAHRSWSLPRRGWSGRSANTVWSPYAAKSSFSARVRQRSRR